MSEIRAAQTSDLAVVASWLRSEADCRLWAGQRVAFPVDADALPAAIEWETSESWCLTDRVNDPANDPANDGAEVVGFGQLVPKPARRLHLARLIAAPHRRGKGLGRLLTAHLLEIALARGPAAVSLNVAADNPVALGLYRSLGFVESPRPPDEPAAESVYMEHAGSFTAPSRGPRRGA